MKKSTANDYRVDGEFAFLILTTRDPGITIEAIIDVAQLDRVISAGRWYAVLDTRSNGHYYVVHCRTLQRLHRFLIDAQPDMVVDHINHNTLDCRLTNLRECTRSENNANRSGATSLSTSGVKNVNWDSHRQRWRVAITKDGKKHRFGSFASIAEAENVAIKARIEIHGEFAG